jgi:hypothetical protein
MNRRDFVRSAGILGAMFLSRSLIACAVRPGDATDSSGADLTSCGPAVIGHNHGHALQVSPEDVAAGVDKTYSIKGAAMHDHQVTVTAAQFATLAAGGAVTIQSTTTVGHSHPVTVTCASSDETDAGSPDASAVCANNAPATIANNHGHTLTVPSADVAAATDKTYSIKGSAMHDHQVAVTAAQFATLASGGLVNIVSTNAFGHAHSVTVICA